MSAVTCRAESVPAVRQKLHYTLGEEFAKATAIYATRDPGAVRDSLDDWLARIGDIRKRLDEVGWLAPEQERDVPVTLSDGFRRATAQRSFGGEGISSKFEEGILTVRWRLGEDA
jgi:hypothetical protein